MARDLDLWAKTSRRGRGFALVWVRGWPLGWRYVCCHSNLYNEATWLDEYGSPHSEEMTVEERYRRVDHDHLEMTLSITDPTAYTGKWQGDRKVFQLVNSPARSKYNDLPEDICVWSETSGR